MYASAGWTRGRAGSAQGSGYFECVAALRRADRGVEALCALFEACRSRSIAVLMMMMMMISIQALTERTEEEYNI